MTKNIGPNQNLSLFFMRAFVGWTFFRAGTGKLFGWSSFGGWAVTDTFFAQLGFPYPKLCLIFVGLVETVCGILLILGLRTRLASFLVACVMFVAIITAHRDSGFDYPFTLFLSCIVLLELGGGRFSLQGKGPK